MIHSKVHTDRYAVSYVIGFGTKERARLMNLHHKIIEQSVAYPRQVIWTIVLVSLALAACMVWIKVDTDPENMLADDEPVRLFHTAQKTEFALHDMVVVGVVNEQHAHGVFNPDSLGKIYELTEYAKTLRWPSAQDPNIHEGVIEVDIIAPSTTDNITQGGLGMVRFEWLMAQPPETQAAALQIRDHAQRIPFLDGTIVSEDGKAIALFIPLTSKDWSYRVYDRLRDKAAELGGPEQYHITGLPVAEDTFGVEMFIQMAISAPLAMLVIFGLLYYFFRQLVLITAPMLIAMLSVLCTMGLLIGLGYTVHIMSSMIPIFVMPIAVLDSVHILSEFFDRYQETRDRRQTLLAVMDELFVPMLYTSLTSAAGFGSLVLASVPPVQVFGVFVAFGIMVAWLFTITFIPAYIMRIKPATLENFGAVKQRDEAAAAPNALSRFLQGVGQFTYRQAGLVLGVSGLMVLVAIYGINQIEINDNPTKWFAPSHPIRVADRVLNQHFGGTYEAYLALEPVGEGTAEAAEQPEIFKQPAVLRYIADLQQAALTTQIVGKSNSLADIVKTVHRELFLGEDEQFRIPDSASAVAQCLITFESGHRPDDLWHFVTPDYRKTSIWFQLRSGDNKDMERVVDFVDNYLQQRPPPVPLQHNWFGLTYINITWQEKMVSGMLNAFLGSFAVVFVMMTVLFRSPLWGLLCMLPLTITIGFIYGVIGLIGKDYDMPVAVLSSLTLGLAVDFAIHFLARTREQVERCGSWRQAVESVFGAPARAIARNIIVVFVGFTPLLLAPLTPYQTVGIFLAAIMAVSGLGTLLILPALVRLLQRHLFTPQQQPAVLQTVK